MRIEGKGNKINVLRFKHKGQDLNFQHIQPSIARTYTDELREPEIGAIEFEDTKEIDEFIKILKYFKDFCDLHTGEWRRPV